MTWKGKFYLEETFAVASFGLRILLVDLRVFELQAELLEKLEDGHTNTSEK